MSGTPVQVDLDDALDRIEAVVAPATPFTPDELAGLGRRITAFVLDAACWLASFFAFLVVAALVAGDGEVDVDGARALVLLLGWSFVWEVLWVAGPSRGKPGQRIAGFRVVRHDGGRVTLVRAGARWLVRNLAWVTGGLSHLVSGVLIATTPRNQSLHDLAAQTLCVRSGAVRRIAQPQFAGSVALPNPPPDEAPSTPQPSSPGPFL